MRTPSAQASCRTRLSSVLSLQGNAKFNWSRSHYTDRDEVHPGGLLSTGFISSVNIHAAAALLYAPAPGLQLDYSVDWVLNNLNSTQPDDTRPYRNSILQMIAAKYRYRWLSVTAKALYSIYINKAVAGEDGKNAGRLSPSLFFHSSRSGTGCRFCARLIRTYSGCPRSTSSISIITEASI